MARLVTLLPEPDSPTMPSVSPRRSVKERPETALHDAVLGRELDREVADVEEQLAAHEYRTRGSRKAYTTSTTRFMITTANVATSTTPSVAGQILAEDRVDGHEAEAVEVEDALGDDGAAHEQRDVETEHGHDRRQARAQAVLEDHALLGQPLGARGADVVLTHRVEQVAADHARVDRRVQQGEHDPGKYQV